MAASAPPSLTKKPSAANTDNNEAPSNVGRVKKHSPILLFVGLCCIISGFFNIINAHWLHATTSGVDQQQHHHHVAQVGKKTSIFRRHGRGGAIHYAMREFLKGKDAMTKKNNGEEIQHEIIASRQLGQGKDTGTWGDAEHPDTLATLSCEAHGGPSTEEAQEMVYWHDIPSDTKYRSPLFRQDGVERYLTFEPDGGGWNNIR